MFCNLDAKIKQMGRTVTPGAYMFTLRIMHFAISLSVLIMGIVIYTMQKDEPPHDPITGIGFWWYLGLAIVLIWLVQYIYIKSINTLRKKENEDSRLRGYVPISALCWGLTEFTAVLGFIFYLLNGDVKFLYAAVVIWAILFFVQHPSKTKVIHHLGLKDGWGKY